MTTSRQIDHEKAIGIIDDVLARVNADRNGHAIMQQCMNVWRELAATVKTQAEALSNLAQDRDDWKNRAETLRAALKTLDPNNALLSGDTGQQPDSASVQ